MKNFLYLAKKIKFKDIFQTNNMGDYPVDYIRQIRFYLSPEYLIAAVVNNFKVVNVIVLENKREGDPLAELVERTSAYIKKGVAILLFNNLHDPEYSHYHFSEDILSSVPTLLNTNPEALRLREEYAYSVHEMISRYDLLFVGTRVTEVIQGYMAHFASLHIPMDFREEILPTLSIIHKPKNIKSTILYIILLSNAIGAVFYDRGNFLMISDFLRALSLDSRQFGTVGQKIQDTLSVFLQDQKVDYIEPDEVKIIDLCGMLHKKGATQRLVDDSLKSKFKTSEFKSIIAKDVLKEPFVSICPEVAPLFELNHLPLCLLAFLPEFKL